MKKILLFLLIPLFSFVAFQKSLPDRIPHWVKKSQVYYELMDIGIEIPDYPNKEITRICRDSFLTTPQAALKVQYRALKYEQVNYGYGWRGVGVGYGMCPGNGNYWEDISVGRAELLPEIKRYLMKKMVKNRATQIQLYNWAKPTILLAFSSKPDTAQALDMFAIYKCKQYLSQYSFTEEKLREARKVDNGIYMDGFTSIDWKNRPDSDAKIYAFWHRRIKESVNSKSGVTLEDARYWMAIASKDVDNVASVKAKAIFNTWKKEWGDGKITNVVFH